MAFTDIVILVISIIAFIRGFSRGFLHSLTGPFSLIVASIFSIYYYQVTQQIWASIIIGLLGPLCLNLLLKYLIKLWDSATDNPIKPTLLSRLGGVALTLAWSWVFLFFTLLLLAVMPPWGKNLTAIHNDVVKSKSFSIVKPFEGAFFANTKLNVFAVTSAASSSDAQSLAHDPRFQKILQDPDIKKEIKGHDIVNLMRNPKMMDLVQQIMNDPVAMKKVMSIYTKPNTAATR